MSSEERRQFMEKETAVKKELKAIILACPIFFKDCAILCKKEFKMQVNLLAIEEYLAGSYYASRARSKDERLYHGWLASTAKKKLNEAEMRILSDIVHLADEIEAEIEKEKNQR